MCVEGGGRGCRFYPTCVISPPSNALRPASLLFSAPPSLPQSSTLFSLHARSNGNMWGVSYLSKVGLHVVSPKGAKLANGDPGVAPPPPSPNEKYLKITLYIRILVPYWNEIRMRFIPIFFKNNYVFSNIIYCITTFVVLFSKLHSNTYEILIRIHGNI